MSNTIHAILRVKKFLRSWFNGKTLRDGEVAYESDDKGLKIGDGGTTYASLPYLIPPRHNEHNKYLKVVNGNVIWADGYDDTAIWTAVNGKYTFPAGGIPKTDLSSSVQGSLDLADTAIQDISGKQDIATLDTDVAALGFVKNTVNDLLNYYLKTETYTQAEVNALIGGMSGFTYEIYALLSDITSPAHNVLYLIGPTGSGSDKYEEYVYPVNDFVKIGDTSIDLSGYVTTSDLNTALAAYTTTTDLTTLLAGYQTKIDANNKLDYSFLDNTPTIPSDTSDLTNGAGFITSSDIPSDVSDFNNDAGYITINDVPAQVQSDWNESDTSSPAYIDNKPSIPAAQIQSDWNQGDNTQADYIKNKPTIPTDTGDLTNGAGYITSADIPPIPNGTYIDIANAGWGPNQVIGAYLRAAYFYNGEVPSKVGDYVYSKSTRCLHKITSITQVGGENVANADFIAFFSGFDGSYSSLSGKPTLGTASALDVPASGDAATTEVVKGDDSRLTDARTPTAHSHTVSEITDFPTLATVATSGDYDDLQNKPTIPAAQVNSDWNASSGVAQILNKPTIPDVSTKYDTGDTVETTLDDADYVPFYDTSASGKRKSLWSNIKAKLKTYFDNYYLTSHQDISGKADKVSGATNGNFAGLDSNGNLTDSGSKASDFQTTINSSNKLSADYIIDGTTNKVINVKPDWNAAAGNAAEILNKPTIPDAVSGTNDGTNWTSLTIGAVTKAIPSGGGGGGLTNYDFTELSAPTISGGACTITFAADQRNAVEFSTNADLSIALVSNNKADNYMWITNSHATTAIDITFSSILFGSTAINDIKGTASIPSIDAGETLEIGIYVTGTKARITSRIL